MTETNNKTTTKKSTKRVSLTDNTSIKVKSAFYGTLYYQNPRTGEDFVWSKAGDIQFLTISDLKTMKAQTVGFFKNQWIVLIGTEDENSGVDPADIYKHLAIESYYKNFIDPSNFDKVCNWTEEEIASKVALMSEGSKQNLIVALNGFIADGILDSRRKIKAFEKALNCELQLS